MLDWVFNTPLDSSSSISQRCLALSQLGEVGGGQFRAHCNASKNVTKTSSNRDLVFLHVEILYEGLRKNEGSARYRSSHRRCSVKSILKSFANCTRKPLCYSLFLTKLQAFRTVKFAKFLRTPILMNIYKSLLLSILRPKFIL